MQPNPFAPLFSAMTTASLRGALNPIAGGLRTQINGLRVRHMAGRSSPSKD